MSTDSGSTVSRPVVVVIGATGGIGSALCRRLHNHGAQLVLVARGPGRLMALADSLQAPCHPLDASHPELVERCLERTLADFGRVDGVANCAGSVLLKPAHLTTDSEWKLTLEANLSTAFAAVRAGARAMQKTGGSIVLVSSAAARVGLPHHDAIAAAKAGVIGLTLSAAATYASARIRVNAVAPGLVHTPMTERIVSNEGALRKSLSLHPLGRIGRPEEIASAIEWLLSEEQSWVTGQVLGVDGGLGCLKV